jgi:hypothetical protein
MGHIWNCLLKDVIEGNTERMRRRGRRRKQLLDAVKETRRYWKVKKEGLGRPVWVIGLGRSYGHLIRQTME